MEYDDGYDYSTATSATLDYLVVGDVGNTIYKIVHTNEDLNNYFKSYDKTTHTVELYSKIIDGTTYLKLKQKVHYDVIVHATETNNGIQYNYSYSYGTPVLVFWNFGDGSYSLEPNPTHHYNNNDRDYQASVMVIDENGVVSVGFGPIVRNNKIVGPSFYVEPLIGKSYDNISIYYNNYESMSYIDIYFLDYNKNSILSQIKDYLSPKPWKSFTNFVTYKVYNIPHLIVSFKIPFEGIYYVEAYDFLNYINWYYDKHHIHYLPRMIKIINNHNPIPKLYIYPKPGSYTQAVIFNPTNTRDPDNGRVLNNSGGYKLSPNEPAVKIYGFNLTVYNSSGNIVWNYTSNELKTISHKFPIGNYTVNLTVWDGMGGINSTVQQFTVINHRPVASFIYYPQNTKINESVYFDASSSYDIEGPIIRYKWNFGDGTIVENGSKFEEHKYNHYGLYNISLTVWDELNYSNSYKKPLIISGILPNFTYSPKYIVANNTVVQFEDTSKIYYTSITERHWDFGDGYSSNDINPTHIYKKPGLYMVTLTVKDSNGKKYSALKYIVVSSKMAFPPVAIFTFNKDGNNITFNASKSYDKDGHIVKYIWEFGDNNTINTTNPIITHYYNKEGVYRVKLTVVDNDNLTGTSIKFVSIIKNEHSIPLPDYVNILIIISTLITVFYLSRRL